MITHETTDHLTLHPSPNVRIKKQNNLKKKKL